ncbi:MAG: tetratricopeptide repeat protein [Muribaculaceae bacterium]|nr:tetratricopeptide repeat protein [Muribaculaceae bacterium]
MKSSLAKLTVCALLSSPFCISLSGNNYHGVDMASLAYNSTSSAADSIYSYEALIDSADYAVKSENWLQAIQYYKDALRINPGSPLNSKLFANIGICNANLGNLTQALESYDIALVKEPTNTNILSHRASTLMLMGDLDGASEVVSEVLHLDSIYAPARRLHGQIMLQKKDFESARKDFEILISIDPKDPWGPAGLAEVEFFYENYPEIIRLLKKALELQESQDFRLSLISAYLKTNKLSDAENLIRESIIIYPQSGEFYVMRGALHKIMHQNREAEADKKTAIQYGVDPKVVERYLPSIPR